MRYAIAVFALLISLAGVGQDYSTKNKKAIKLYEDAIQSYTILNRDLAIDLLLEARAKDPEFVETYLMMAQIKSELGKAREAIDNLESGMKINPTFFPIGYCTLGELYLHEGDYELADKNFRIFIDTGRGSDELKILARLGMKNCAFAKEAMANPVDFVPVNMGPGVNSEYSEYYPCLTADEGTLLYTRVIPDSRSMNKIQEDFYVSQKDGGEWGQSIGIQEVNTPMNEGAPTLSHDGQVLIFTACEIDGNWGFGRNGLGSCDLFFSQKIGREWSQPMNLGEKVNSFSWDSQPSLAADGRTLYFVRGKSTAHGIKQQDIYVSHLGDDGYWQKPKKVEGYVNTAFEEESVLIHPDGETMYFSSNGHVGMGGLDIYMSKKQNDGSWGEPINLGYPINTHGDENSLLVSASGELAVFASDREGGYGDLDLYTFELPEGIRPNKVTYTRGEVFDALSFKKLGAQIEVLDLETGELVCESYSNTKTGEFLVCLPVGRDYALNASREGYLFYSANFSLKGMHDLEVKELEVPMEKIKVGSKVVLNNIFFESGDYSLKPQSEVELDKLVEFLNVNRNLRIEIGGHTDDVGSDSDNQILSENRAKEVVKYLMGHGIDDYRLVAKGYGETSPVADNGSEEGRALNRRTEFMVIE